MDFELKDSFVEIYKNITPPFGFNGLGELTYMRTYSRLKEDGTNEKWYETVRRVVEGTYSIQKRHIFKYDLGWDKAKATRSAEEMYDRMFNMKFLPAGRGIWAMGSDSVEKKGLFQTLNNCAFVSTENLVTDKTKPFLFMMDMEMLGVGVGFDVKGAGKLKIKSPRKSNVTTVWQILDSREGWVESLDLLLSAYFDGDKEWEFDYSKIRIAGEPIAGFGGKSAGPKPLRKLHTELKHLLEKRISEYLTITDITDIMNMIGVCIVAANVRSSAQIVFGDPNSEEFLKLKDYEWDSEKETYHGSNVHRAAYGWTSNNSVFAELGMDYSKLSIQTARNGEPGYVWLDNMRSYGRMKDESNGKDSRAVGSNPCSEQTLESYEMCCLVDVFPTRNEDIKDFKRTLKFAYLYAKTVTLGKTSWVETNRVQLRNRRIGTSLTGIAEFVDKNGIEQFRLWCNEGYEILKYYDTVYSEWFAVPKSIKITSVKPSGTVSILAGVTPGMHYPESNYYIRRIRLSTTSDLINSIKEAGYRVEASTHDPENTLIVEVPTAIEGVRTVDQVNLWEQLSLAAFLQEHWADNQVSCTITFKPEEANQIGPALNYFQYKLKGVSFLPKTETGAYSQMPYEEITKEEYETLSKNIKKLKFKQTSEESEQERFCDGQSCIL
ncbi:MAG TPA: fused protease/ribonucleoside-triphosphate reductase [Candidatus Bathyarchaeia archaeon]|nr:fused protease/ribonucleoside-triphosphate reductase [Candidatus Bathyarchaeia archaeon]